MSGICGWLNSNNPTTDPQDCLQRMCSPLGESSQRKTLATPQWGIASVSTIKPGDILSQDNIHIAYEGQPRWHDEKYRTLAEQKGMAHAIANAYQTHKTAILQQLWGPFCLAIIDTANQTLLLAIDRIGVRPLSFSHTTQGIIFGSHLDSLRTHPQFLSNYDSQAIFNYLYFHMVPSPRCIYQGVDKLLPGQYVLFNDGKITKDFYWQLPYADNNPTSENQLIDEFHSVLRTAVKRQGSDAATGAFLSGGTDSSTTTGILSELMGDKSTNTFSIGFDAEGFDETEYARTTAKHFNTQHHEYRVTPEDVVDAIPLIAQAYDEPFGNASAVPTYYCAKLAKQNQINILLAGDGGDEIFAGNERYAKQRIFEYYYYLPKLLRNQIVKPLSQLFPENSSVTPMRKLRSYVDQASIPLPQRLETYNFLNRTPLAQIFNPNFLASIDINEPLSLCQETYERTQSSLALNKMMHLDLKNTLADNDLRKVNRACEMAGIDVRYPLLDEDLVQFAARVPTTLHIKNGKQRYFFKQALTGFLPQTTLTKTKHGFGLPFGLWLNEHAGLKALANDSLNDLIKRQYLKQDYITQLLKQHQTEHASYYGVMIWVLMSLEQWFKAHENS